MIYSTELTASLDDIVFECVIKYLEKNAHHFLSKKRKREAPIDFWQTPWGKTLRNPAIEDPLSWAGSYINMIDDIFMFYVI